MIRWNVTTNVGRILKEKNLINTSQGKHEQGVLSTMRWNYVRRKVCLSGRRLLVGQEVGRTGEQAIAV